MSNATDTDGADAIVADYEGWAGPILTSMAGLTEDIARTLTTPARIGVMARYQALDSEGRAQMRPGLMELRVPRTRRGALSIDLSQLKADAERGLSRWLNGRRAAADRARAELAPPPDVIARAQALAGLPSDGLLAEASRLLEAGDAAEADVNLRAALATGRLRTGPSTTYGTLRRRCDAALDEAVPERAAVVAALVADGRDYKRATERVAEFRRAADALIAADPEDPSEEVARARMLAEAGARTDAAPIAAVANGGAS